MIEYKQTTIAPAGRNKYGNYMSSGNITKSVTMTTYAGNDTTNSLGDTGNTEDTGTTNFYCMLSKTTAIFDEFELANIATATTSVIAYRGYNKAVTYVCDMESVSAVTDNDGAVIEVLVPDNQGIRNLPAGMSATCINNGTSATSIMFTASDELTGVTGNIYIPVCVYKRDDNVPPADDAYNWYGHAEFTEQLWLEFTWNVNRAATSNYVLDLSNERAQINCDSAGTMFSASIMTVTCSASTTMNGEPVVGMRYSASTLPQYNARGININPSTGEIWFTYSGSSPYFAFDGASLPINVYSEIQEGGEWVRKPSVGKTMTIYKNYPGADGSPAVSHWIVTSVSQIAYNPNTQVYFPSAVTATCWRQVGYNVPEIDSATTIYTWWESYYHPVPYTGPVTMDNAAGNQYLAFGLKNQNDEFYEIETIPILSSGLDGQSGATGASGATGESGKSAWYMTLSNDNSSINCDEDGNVLEYAVRPDPCKVKMFYGDERRTDATYEVSSNTPYTGITTATSNGILTITFSAGTLGWEGTLLQLTISGTSSGDVRDEKTINISKAYAGASGQPAITYWLSPDFTEVIYDVNNHSCNPTKITCEAYKQVGQSAPTTATDATIKYQWQNRNTGSFTSESTYPSTGISVTTANCESYRRLRLKLKVGDSQYDLEDIDILKDGANGEAGAQGRQGAAIRGPFDYYSVSSSTQCWCGGQSGSTCEECDKWIDVIYKDGVYYYCNTTYYGTINAGLSANPSKWTSGSSFDFVATKVLLASAASINFLTNNWLYLRDEDGNIVGGARGTSVDSGITFWSGDEDPENAEFKVDYQGNIYAQKGVFAGYIQYPYTFVSQLTYSASNYTYYADGRAYLVSDSYTQSHGIGEPGNLVLPTPNSGLNGFTYDIIVEPSLSRMDGNQQLRTTVSGGSDIYCYAYSELRVASAYTLTGGRYQITCMPKRLNNELAYRWAITQATGGMESEMENKVEYLSTLLGTSYDTSYLVNKVLTYTGSTKPSVPSTGSTMYVNI